MVYHPDQQFLPINNLPVQILTIYNKFSWWIIQIKEILKLKCGILWQKWEINLGIVVKIEICIVIEIVLLTFVHISIIYT